MGAGPSSDDEGEFGVAQPLQMKSSRASWRSGKRSLVTRWQRRQLQSQIFAVVRHAERADSVYAFYKGGRWTQSEDFCRYPVDPPLSDTGLQAAAEDTAQVVRAFASDHCTQIPIIVTSPYLRCVQTAAEICRELGPKARILIDRGLGEVFGPSIMGEVQPVCLVRPIDQIVQYCRELGVRCMSRAIGEWPVWPEDLKSARRRYAHRFLEYLRRSAVTRRNFVIVTHGDAVGASLSVMPSQAGKRLEKVEFGGMFMASRSVSGASPSAASTLGRGGAEDRPSSCGAVGSGRRSNGRGSGLFSSVMPGLRSHEAEDEAALESEPDLDDGAIWRSLASMDNKPRRSASAWDTDSDARPGGTVLFKGQQVREFLAPEPEPPKASDGWLVQTYDIAVHEKMIVEDSPSRGSMFSKKVSSLVKSGKFSRPQIEALLGELSDQPLGGFGSDGNLLFGRPGSNDAPQRGLLTQSSFSTYAFGASDFQSELGSEMSDLNSACACESRIFTESSLDGITPGMTGGESGGSSEQALSALFRLSGQTGRAVTDGVIGDPLALARGGPGGRRPRNRSEALKRHGLWANDHSPDSPKVLEQRSPKVLEQRAATSTVIFEDSVLVHTQKPALQRQASGKRDNTRAVTMPSKELAPSDAEAHRGLDGRKQRRTAATADLEAALPVVTSMLGSQPSGCTSLRTQSQDGIDVAKRRPRVNSVPRNLTLEERSPLQSRKASPVVSPSQSFLFEDAILEMPPEKPERLQPQFKCIENLLMARRRKQSEMKGEVAFSAAVDSGAGGRRSLPDSFKSASSTVSDRSSQSGSQTPPLAGLLRSLTPSALARGGAALVTATAEGVAQAMSLKSIEGSNLMQRRMKDTGDTSGGALSLASSVNAEAGTPGGSTGSGMMKLFMAAADSSTPSGIGSTDAVSSPSGPTKQEASPKAGSPADLCGPAFKNLEGSSLMKRRQMAAEGGGASKASTPATSLPSLAPTLAPLPTAPASETPLLPSAPAPAGAASFKGLDGSSLMRRRLAAEASSPAAALPFLAPTPAPMPTTPASETPPSLSAPAPARGSSFNDLDGSSWRRRLAAEAKAEALGSASVAAAQDDSRPGSKATTEASRPATPASNQETPTMAPSAAFQSIQGSRLMQRRFTGSNIVVKPLQLPCVGSSVAADGETSSESPTRPPSAEACQTEASQTPNSTRFGALDNSTLMRRRSDARCDSAPGRMKPLSVEVKPEAVRPGSETPPFQGAAWIHVVAARRDG